MNIPRKNYSKEKEKKKKRDGLYPDLVAAVGPVDTW
jgi:hypothetical protein